MDLLSGRYNYHLDTPSWVMIQKNGRKAGPSIDHIHFHMIPIQGTDMYKVLLGEVTKIDSEHLTREQIVEYRKRMERMLT